MSSALIGRLLHFLFVDNLSSSIPHSGLVGLLMTVYLNYLPVKLLISVSLEFFPYGFFSFLHQEHIPLASHFFDFLCLFL